MTLNLEKSKVTNNIEEIEVLSYRIGMFGQYPYKQPEKLSGQLLFPERDFQKDLAAYRAIRIAFANLGQDLRVHEICERMYNTYNNKIIIIIKNKPKKKEDSY